MKLAELVRCATPIKLVIYQSLEQGDFPFLKCGNILAFLKEAAMLPILR